MRAAIAARMRRLYSLAFHACGASHRAVQRSIGRDVRSMMAANDIPTLASVIDLARALDMRPSVAVELLVHGGPDPDAARSADCVDSPIRPAGELLDEPLLLAADLADDDAVLERILVRIPPERTVLHTALLARIFTIRGSTARALTLLQSADIGSAEPGAMRLLRAAIGEIAILRPEAIDAIRTLSPSLARPARDRTSIHTPGLPSNPTHQGIEVRDRFHRLATDALLAPETGRDVAIVERLAHELDLVRRSENHQAIAWAASITVLTALAPLSRKPRDPAAADRLRRISVLAGFALDDVIRCGEPTAERLACARRARVVLAERTTRARCGEDPFGLLDSADLAELRAATLRFPEADLFVHPFRNFGTFSQHRHSALDERTFRLQMPQGSRCARGVARANP
ncbi:MAG: hypothetical protein LW806_11955 [Planctomycetaceae bacterium]|nr:hypothetical protein [Planctomycetaceae bacterium]